MRASTPTIPTPAPSATTDEVVGGAATRSWCCGASATAAPRCSACRATCGCRSPAPTTRRRSTRPTTRARAARGHRHPGAGHPDQPLRRDRLRRVPRPSSTPSAAWRSARCPPPRTPTPGCGWTRAAPNLDGSMALAYARSRHYEEWIDGDWVEAPGADLGRIERQQLFIRTAVDQAAAADRERPVRPRRPGRRRRRRRSRIDEGLDPSKAADALREAAEVGLQTYTLPVEGVDEGRPEALELLDEAQPILDYFRGVGARRRRRRPPPTTTGWLSPAVHSRPMKALILAGGAGTRLRPITHTRAKQLVPVANTPILFYGIGRWSPPGSPRSVSSPATPGPRSARRSVTAAAFGASITYIPQDAPLGLAHCVLIAREFLGDDDFVMYLGDNLLEQDLGAFVERVRDGTGRRRSAGRPDPAQAGARPAPLRHRHARRRRPRRRPRREAGRPAVGPRPRRRLPVRPDDPRGRAGDRALGARRAGDHRRHPVADHVRPPGAHRAAHRLVDRHRQADAAARGQPAAAREARAAASTARSTSCRRSTAGSSSSRAPRSSTRRCAGRSPSAPGPASSTASSVRSAPSAPTARSSTARSSTPS